jgi:hypothetical protein
MSLTPLPRRFKPYDIYTLVHLHILFFLLTTEFPTHRASSGNSCSTAAGVPTYRHYSETDVCMHIYIYIYTHIYIYIYLMNMCKSLYKDLCYPGPILLGFVMEELTVG